MNAPGIAPVIDLSRRLVAVAERERLAGFLTAIATARLAQETCDGFDSPERADTAAARDALDACLMAEDRVLALALDPGLATFFVLILEQLNTIAGEAACA